MFSNFTQVPLFLQMAVNNKKQMINENKLTFFSTGSFGLKPQLPVVEGGEDVAEIGSATAYEEAGFDSS
jgi:hypothetical protein